MDDIFGENRDSNIEIKYIKICIFRDFIDYDRVFVHPWCTLSAVKRWFSRKENILTHSKVYFYLSLSILGYLSICLAFFSKLIRILFFIPYPEYLVYIGWICYTLPYYWYFSFGINIFDNLNTIIVFYSYIILAVSYFNSRDNN